MNMSDSEDRWKLLKKERAARTRAESIHKTWREIESKPDLTTREKLEKLITLTGTTKKEKHREEPEPEKRKRLELFENQYRLQTRYGKIPIGAGLKISGDVLAILSRDQGFAGHGLSSALFLDLETTGLSGGVGVVPFLIGLGYYRDSQFHISQFFLGDLAEEERLILQLGQFLNEMEFRSVVTFNGKGFDLPLLETRFVLHRQPLPLRGLPHLDFLFSARSLWSHKQESCRLYHL
ncbi:MAG: ribonuclease H-like domain-containing protein, partial [Acidobacteriota bacterium]